LTFARHVSLVLEPIATSISTADPEWRSMVSTRYPQARFTSPRQGEAKLR
jgi:hypothetical protein